MKSAALLLALAACLAVALAKPETKLGACDRRALNYLDSQIQICARNVPVQQYSDPRWRCARSVTSSLGRSSSCSLESAPELLQECLEDNYIYPEDVTPAVDCLRNSISAGICC